MTTDGHHPSDAPAPVQAASAAPAADLTKSEDAR